MAGSAGRAPPAPGAQDRPRGAQPVLTTPRSGSPGGGRGGRCGWSRSRVSAGRGSRRRENGGGGGGGEEGQRRLEAAAPAHAAQPQQPGSPTAQAGRPWRQGLYRGQRGPRPFLPPPPPARPAPPSRRLLCVPAGRRVPVPALRGAPAPATAQPRPPPTGSRRWTEPRKRRETRRPRGAAPARAELHVGRRVPGVCVCGRGRDPRACGASLGLRASNLGCPPPTPAQERLENASGQCLPVRVMEIRVPGCDQGETDHPLRC